MEVLQRHYQHLGKISVDSDFGKRKLRIYEVSSYASMSELYEDDPLAIKKGGIVKCIRKLSGESDGLVGELLKYGGSGMVCLPESIGACNVCVGAFTCRCTCKCDNVHSCMGT